MNQNSKREMEINQLWSVDWVYAGRSNDGEEYIVRLEFGLADVQDMSASVQRTETTAVSAHVLQILSSLPRQS